MSVPPRYRNKKSSDKPPASDGVLIVPAQWKDQQISFDPFAVLADSSKEMFQALIDHYDGELPHPWKLSMGQTVAPNNATGNGLQIVASYEQHGVSFNLYFTSMTQMNATSVHKTFLSNLTNGSMKRIVETKHLKSALGQLDSPSLTRPFVSELDHFALAASDLSDPAEAARCIKMLSDKFSAQQPRHTQPLHAALWNTSLAAQGIVAACMGNQDSSVFTTAYERSDCPAEAFLRAPYLPSTVQTLAASHANCPSMVMELLADATDELVRATVASSPYVTDDVAARLMNDPSQSVRTALTKNGAVSGRIRTLVVAAYPPNNRNETPSPDPF